jgi:hypothetical protein
MLEQEVEVIGLIHQEVMVVKAPAAAVEEGCIITEIIEEAMAAQVSSSYDTLNL